MSEPTTPASLATRERPTHCGEGHPIKWITDSIGQCSKFPDIAWEWRAGRLNMAPSAALFGEITRLSTKLIHVTIERDEAQRQAEENASDYRTVIEAFDASGLTLLYEVNAPEAQEYADSIKKAGEEWTSVRGHLGLIGTDYNVPNEVLRLLGKVDAQAAALAKLRPLIEEAKSLGDALRKDARE